ncbi:hypothetical protein AMECASPLE_030815 [Ameca splendens]|uniref:SBNO alpha/beta domain-containing protein n=1 Tax=Ameca splendens TaxID=208324 RepID=A0ABV1ACH2_9TELE
MVLFQVTFMEARESWENQFTFSFKNCSHANWNGKCKKIEEGQECLAGMRLRQYHMLCGALLRVWKRVSDVVSDITSSSILQIVRLKTKQHNKQVGIKIPENCVARVREELQLMDDEVKRRRKEKEQQERMRKMEQENKHLLSLFSQKPIPNQSLAQTLVPNHFTKHNLNQNTVQRTQPGSVSQLQDMQQLLSLQSQTQCRTLNGWPNSSSSSSTNGQVCQPNTADHRFSPFYNQSSFMPPFQQPKNPLIPLHQFPPAHSLSSKNPLDEILDLTVSPPSSSPDSTTANPAAFVDDFNLEALLAPTMADTSNAAQIQQPQIDLQHLLQALQYPPETIQAPPPQFDLQRRLQPHQEQQKQQQNRNMLAAHNPQDLLDLLDLPLSPPMSTQTANPSSSTSSCTSSTSSTSSHFSNPSSSSSSSSSSSLFSGASSCFPGNYLLPPSDSLPNGHCSSGTLDVREALNSMLQAGPDRKSVIQYRQQD